MSDVHTPLQRSRNMSAIKGHGNKSTEEALIKLFRANKIKGWKRHSSVIGKPDFVFTKQKIAIFTDGCFWHGCSKCNLIPASNRIFWREKISNNKLRDRKVNRLLKKQGWKVIRIWEHEIKKNSSSISQKLNYLTE